MDSSSAIAYTFFKGNIRQWLTNLSIGYNRYFDVGIVGVERLFTIKYSSREKLASELNRLRRKIPNFLYLFGSFTCSSPVIANNKVLTWCIEEHNSQYLVYESLYPYYSMNKFNEDILFTNDDQLWLNAYLQVIYSLYMSNKLIGFVHGSLNTYNVFIRYLPDKSFFSIRYDTGEGIKYINTNFIATIASHDKSYTKYSESLNKNSVISNAHSLLMFSAEILGRPPRLTISRSEYEISRLEEEIGYIEMRITRTINYMNNISSEIDDLEKSINEEKSNLDNLEALLAEEISGTNEFYEAEHNVIESERSLKYYENEMDKLKSSEEIRVYKHLQDELDIAKSKIKEYKALIEKSKKLSSIGELKILNLIKKIHSFLVPDMFGSTRENPTHPDIEKRYKYLGEKTLPDLIKFIHSMNPSFLTDKPLHKVINQDIDYLSTEQYFTEMLTKLPEIPRLTYFYDTYKNSSNLIKRRIKRIYKPKFDASFNQAMKELENLEYKYKPFDVPTILKRLYVIEKRSKEQERSEIFGMLIDEDYLAELEQYIYNVYHLLDLVIQMEELYIAISFVVNDVYLDKSKSNIVNDAKSSIFSTIKYLMYHIKIIENLIQETTNTKMKQNTYEVLNLAKDLVESYKSRHKLN